MWHPQRSKTEQELLRVIAINEQLTAELARVSRVVRPTTEMQRVIGAVAHGDLTKKITGEVDGELVELKDTINGMVDQLNRLVSEVTRVAREVGTEGKLGQAAAVTVEVGGVWKDLTDNVNLMAGNLTGQVRNIAEVTTAVANGDLSKKITADVQGEFLELKNTVNAMVDQLNRFASEVTRVAREVGVEGKLGGQAQSAEVAGVWKDLTDNVNQLAANLTSQVRAIAEVATAVTEGDLTRQVGVEASGEVAVLKDKLNEMIRNLRETTRQNTEQDWLKTNLERFTRMLQGHRDIGTVSNMILSELAPLVSAHHGVFYALTAGEERGEPVLRRQAGYGQLAADGVPEQFRLGEGLIGQCALDQRRIILTDVPPGYVQIHSGLGNASPLNIIVLPILFEGSVRAVVELASLSRFSATHLAFLDQLTDSMGVILNTIEANALTETLLEQSQSQAHELRSRNQEIELAKRLVEEKADQLALSSSYKSEFFANMSHELRTPLNSLLILAHELKANGEQNLTDLQVEYASVIHSSGSDLLELLNDILDLAKVESGTVVLEIGPLELEGFFEAIESEFRAVADQRGLAFTVEPAPGLPSALLTDPRRLRQVLKNLLANAFKFTELGEVRLRVSSEEHDVLGPVTAFAISDTGIGITPEMQQRMFEAFAQADGTTAREYGGTGLGLSISRELVRLLGGEIALSSQPERGSTFTVYLPPVAATAAVTHVEPDDDAIVEALLVQQPPIETLAGRTALVIDDDFRNVFALTSLLERGGLTVLSSESGEEGVEILARTPEIDVVLVDIMMPVMDGYATIRAMRQLPGGGELPIVALTANVAAGESRRCTDAGASAYVSKPVDTDELLRLLVDRLPASVVRT